MSRQEKSSRYNLVTRDASLQFLQRTMPDDEKKSPGGRKINRQRPGMLSSPPQVLPRGRRSGHPAAPQRACPGRERITSGAPRRVPGEQRCDIPDNPRISTTLALAWRHLTSPEQSRHSFPLVRNSSLPVRLRLLPLGDKATTRARAISGELIPTKQRRLYLTLRTTLPLARPVSTYAKASRVDSNGKTRSTTGRITPESMRDVISLNCSPLALMKRNE
jgi:hypothetical protein